MNALIITGKLVQDHEFIYPYYRLQEAGYTVYVATEDGKDTVGQLGTKIPSNTSFATAYANEESGYYGLLVIPGGAKCLEYIRQNRELVNFIAAFNAKGKVIASICHGAQMLISAKVVVGRRISGYYSIRDDLENAGAIYVDAPAVVDGNIVSCPHYKHMGAWMKAVLDRVGLQAV